MSMSRCVNEPAPQQGVHTGEDYRSSHLNRGEDYDAELTESPFEKYISLQETRILGSLVQQLFPHGIDRHLDFACGTGRITCLIAPKARTSYGVDVSPQMMEQARKRCPKTEFVLRDVTREPLSLAPFDLVTAFRFFGNAQDELRVSALRAIWAMLKPGGYLIINNHRNLWCIRNLALRLTGNAPDGDLSYGKLRRLLHQEGFQVISKQGIGVWIVRAAFMDTHILESKLARVLERLSRLEPLAILSPDAVIVVRKHHMAMSVGAGAHGSLGR
jgi:ubiquinone/menaquinone biosynthesis C-methylase UbiE